MITTLWITIGISLFTIALSLFLLIKASKEISKKDRTIWKLECKEIENINIRKRKLYSRYAEELLGLENKITILKEKIDKYRLARNNEKHMKEKYLG